MMAVVHGGALIKYCIDRSDQNQRFPFRRQLYLFTYVTRTEADSTKKTFLLWTVGQVFLRRDNSVDTDSDSLQA
jgi:hypothetical protein